MCLPHGPLLTAMLIACSTLAVDAPDLSALGDEFDDPSRLAEWTRFDRTFGWPDKIRHLDVGKSTRGTLHLEPYHSAWVRDLNAPFLYKTVAGDFDVRARLRVRGHDGATPTDTWALGGLLVRHPTRTDAGHWEPRRENWLFITTGVGDTPGEVVTEAKSTVNSESSLKLRPFIGGWVELRIVHVGTAFILLARPEGDRRWQVRDRIHRMMVPPELQVGLAAYTQSTAAAPGPDDPERSNRNVLKDLPVDMILEVDWVRFGKPLPSYPGDWHSGVALNQLTDSAVGDEELLRRLGE